MHMSPVLIALTAVIAAFAAPAAGLGEPRPGLVSITMDDGSRSQYEYGLSLARKHHIPGTLYIATGLINAPGATPADAWLMNWDEIREFRDAGWDIGAHGRTHVRLTEQTPQQLVGELDGPIADIRREIGVAPVSFSSPYGAFDDTTIAAIMARYRAHVSWKGHGGRNPVAGTDPRFVGRFEVVKEMSSPEVCGEMVRAQQTGTWLVLLFHGFVDQDPGDYQITGEMLDEIFGCAEVLDRAGVIKVVTVRQALDAIAARNAASGD